MNQDLSIYILRTFLHTFSYYKKQLLKYLSVMGIISMEIMEMQIKSIISYSWCVGGGWKHDKPANMVLNPRGLAAVFVGTDIPMRMLPSTVALELPRPRRRGERSRARKSKQASLPCTTYPQSLKLKIGPL